MSSRDESPAGDVVPVGRRGQHMVVIRRDANGERAASFYWWAYSSRIWVNTAGDCSYAKPGEPCLAWAMLSDPGGVSLERMIESVRERLGEAYRVLRWYPRRPGHVAAVVAAISDEDGGELAFSCVVCADIYVLGCEGVTDEERGLSWLDFAQRRGRLCEHAVGCLDADDWPALLDQRSGTVHDSAREA